MKKRKKRKKRKKLTQDERDKKQSLTGYPWVDGIIYLAAFMAFVNWAPETKSFFGSFDFIEILSFFGK